MQTCRHADCTYIRWLVRQRISHTAARPCTSLFDLATSRNLAHGVIFKRGKNLAVFIDKEKKLFWDKCLGQILKL
jgi:hypothetical protein